MLETSDPKHTHWNVYESTQRAQRCRERGENRDQFSILCALCFSALSALMHPGSDRLNPKWFPSDNPECLSFHPIFRFSLPTG
jgi:hypothetical protein